MDRQEAQTLLGHIESAAMLVAITGASDRDAGNSPYQRAQSLQGFVRRVVLDRLCECIAGCEQPSAE